MDASFIKPSRPLSLFYHYSGPPALAIKDHANILLEQNRASQPTMPSKSTASRGLGACSLYLALLIPHIALTQAAAAGPVCVEQALNEFENGSPCSLGDQDCYCSAPNKSRLYSDIEEACVNDAGARASECHQHES
jgi:hypothetical protein